jgi:hypothetical protein
VEQLLKETEGYLQKLGVKLQKQKELSKLEDEFTESNLVLNDAVVVQGKDQTQVCDCTLLLIRSCQWCFIISYILTGGQQH